MTTELSRARAANAADPSYRAPDPDDYPDVPESPAELRYRAAEELAAEFGTDVSEWLI